MKENLKNIYLANDYSIKGRQFLRREYRKKGLFAVFPKDEERKANQRKKNERL